MSTRTEPANYVLRDGGGRIVAKCTDGMLVRLSRVADLAGSWRDLRRAYLVDVYHDAATVDAVARTEAVLWAYDTSPAGRRAAERRAVDALLSWVPPEVTP